MENLADPDQYDILNLQNFEKTGELEVELESQSSMLGLLILAGGLVAGILYLLNKKINRQQANFYPVADHYFDASDLDESRINLTNFGSREHLIDYTGGYEDEDNL